MAQEAVGSSKKEKVMNGAIRIIGFWSSVGMLIAGAVTYTLWGAEYRPLLIGGGLLTIAYIIVEWYRRRKLYAES